LEIQSFLHPILSLGNGNDGAFHAAGQAMAELFTAGVIGSSCVNLNILDSQTVQALSKTTISILLPMFLCTSIMKTISLYGVNKSSLVIPCVAIVHCFLTYLIASNLLPFLGLDCDTTEGKSTITCCAFGNSGVLPLIFAGALFNNFDPSLLQEATSKISLYLLGWSPYFWSFGRSKLLGKDGSTDISLKSMCPPPVLGIFTGLALSLFAPLRCLFMGFPEKRQAPLAVLYNTVQNLGRAASPLALLVLTSSLALGNNSATMKKLKAPHGIDNDTTDSLVSSQARRFWAVFITRSFISPLLMMTMLRFIFRLGVIESIDVDPMLWFILMLEASMPPAQNSVVMLHAGDKPAEAAQLASFLFKVYFAAMIPVVLITTILLKQCKIQL